MVTERLTTPADENKLLQEAQGGFRRGERLCGTNVHTYDFDTK